MKHLRRISTILFCFWAAFSEAQDDRFVAPDGMDDDNSCQEAGNPCASIRHALTQANPRGDIIHLAPGVYIEPGLAIEELSITLLGAGEDQTFIQPASSVGLSSNRVLSVGLRGTVVVEHVTFRYGRTADGAESEDSEGGAAENGGGIQINGDVTLRRCRVLDNATGSGGSGAAGFNGGRGGDGGGIYCDGSLELSECTVEDNVTGSGGVAGQGGVDGRGGDGAAIHNSNRLLVDRSTISRNRTATGGDATIFNLFNLTIRSSTISDNATGTGGKGGGLLNHGSAQIAHATFAANRADEGGGIYNSSGTLDIFHTLIAGNESLTASEGPDISGAWNSSGFNLIQTTNGWTSTGAGNLVGLDPLLGPLTNNGGATFTRRLPPLSPAVNAGDSSFAGDPATDQRGVARVQGGRIDIGAFELANTALYVEPTGTDDQNECRDSAYPCGSLNHALSQALPGDEIIMEAGTHTVSGVSIDRFITISGDSSTASILQAASSPDATGDRLLTILPGVTALIQRVTIQNGHAPDGGIGSDGEDGGAIFNEGALHLSDCIVQNNRAGRGGDQSDPEQAGGYGGSGGAIRNQFNASLLIERCVFSDNRAGDGGANAYYPGDAGSGGALWNAGVAMLDQVEFVENSAGSSAGFAGSGGAIRHVFGSLVVERSSFSANLSDAGVDGGKGGALFSSAPLWVENSTFYANHAGGSGGAIYGEYEMSLRHSTIASNTSEISGGGLQLDSAARLSHLLLARNNAPVSPDVSGALFSEGYNLIGDPDGWFFEGGSSLEGAQSGVEPIFEAFGWHGGPTRTLPLAEGSAGQDQGDPAFAAPPATDQRGVPRVDGGRIDLGSFETFNQDDDRDGLPDVWEIEYGFDPFDPGITNLLAGPLGDPDEDGFDNLSEYIAMTRPDRGDSYFRIQSVSAGTGAQIAVWSVTGRLYTLFYSDSLIGPIWSNSPGNVDIAGQDAVKTFTNETPAAHRHYGVGVRLANP